MTETPETGDQNQEKPEIAQTQSPGKEQTDAVGLHGAAQPEGQGEMAQNGAAQAQPSTLAEVGARNQDELPVDEREEEARDDGRSQSEQEEPGQAEAERRKKRLEEPDPRIKSQQAKRDRSIKQQEKDRSFAYSKSDISLQLLDDDMLARKEDRLFVRPGDYQRFLDEITEDTGNHILIVSGKKSSGKFMTAFYLARDVWEKKGLRYYRFSAQGNRTLLDIWMNENLPDNSVILFDEVFNKEQIDPDDLTNRYVHLNGRLVEKTNIWFIFTVLEGPILERLQATRHFPVLSTAQVDRRQVLEKLIDYHFPKDVFSEEVRDSLLSFKGDLPTPERLSHLFEIESDPKAIRQGFTQEDLPQETPSVWFSQLTPMNYQLYALLAVLFDELDLPTLEEIYTLVVHALRRQGMDSPDEFIDPRRIGTNLMHARLRIQVRYTKLEFRDLPYKQYVEAQVENYQRLLWSLIDPDDPSTFEGLFGLIRHLSEIEAQAAASQDQSRQLRYAIAVMIARVGVYHQTKLDILLTKLVRDESAVVSLTAAQVLAEIARRGMHFDYIERILQAWIQSRRFDQMWAVAPSIAYIYISIANTLEEERSPREAMEEDDADLEAFDEESAAKIAKEQKKQGKGYLAKLREILTDLARVHHVFSNEAIEEASNTILLSYLAGIRKYYEESTEPITEQDGRLFRELMDGDKERFLGSVYTERREVITEAVGKDVEDLQDSWVNQMRMVLVQTLEQIMHMWPRDVTRLIRLWLDRKAGGDAQGEGERDPLWEIGHMGVNYLFQKSIAIEDPSLLEQIAYPLLDLIPLAMRVPVLTRESLLQDLKLLLHSENLEGSVALGLHRMVGDLMRGDALIYALVALQRWYENLGQAPTRQEKVVGATAEEEEEEEELRPPRVELARRQNWQEKVSAVLANAMNSAPQPERQRLRNALFLWVRTEDRVLNRIARTLISHAYVMDGIVLDLPTCQRVGLVVIDSQRKELEDRESMSYLLQSLSAIVPIHLHWLGYTHTSSSRPLQGDYRGESGQAEERIASFGPDDLLLRSANRPSLLMPIIQPAQGQGYLPAQTYFAVVFHTEEILDLAELYPGLGVAQEPRRENIFSRRPQNVQVASLSSDQPWYGKVYLQSTAPEPEIPDSLAPLLTIVRKMSIAKLEEELRKRVAITLRFRSASSLWQELRAFIGEPVPQQTTVASLIGEIEHWLKQLADTRTLYPDVSLFILWTVMVRSRENLSEARQLIEFLLREPEETGAEQRSRQEEKNARRARRLRQQMGIACTRMLFNLYGTGNSQLPVEPYEELLLLLPQMMACAASVSEITPILAILFELVRVDHWLRVVNDDEGAFFESMQKVSLKELDLLLSWVEDYHYLVDLSRLFLELELSFHDFVGFGEEVSQRYGTNRSERSARGASLPPPGEKASKFMALLPAKNDAWAQGRYTWALQQLEFQQASLRQPGLRETVLASLRNQEALLTHLAYMVQTRKRGTIERLKEGDFYGVVLVEAGNRDAVHQAFLFVQEFVTRRRQNKGQHITLMVQRLGEKEVLAKIKTGRKIRNEREISDRRQLPQLMGPLLECYPADQVTFVLLITDASVLDYDDWAEQDDWVQRLWLARQGKWHPYRGEIVTLEKENTQLILETILKTSGREGATL